MKYLLMFLISFNLLAAVYPRIDKLTVKKTRYRLLKRMNKVCDFSVKPYTCEGGRPTSFAMENELVLLKAELYIKEDARLAERARIKDLKKRFKKIKHSKHKVLKVSNPAAWFRDNKKSMDKALMESKMQELEAADAQVKIDLKAKGDVKTAKDAQKSSDCVKLKNSNKYPLYLKRLFYEKLCN